MGREREGGKRREGKRKGERNKNPLRIGLVTGLRLRILWHLWLFSAGASGGRQGGLPP